MNTVAFIGGIVGRMLDPALIVLVAAIMVASRKLPIVAGLMFSVAASGAAYVAFTTHYPHEDLGIPITQTALGALFWAFAVYGIMAALKPTSPAR